MDIFLGGEGFFTLSESLVSHLGVLGKSRLASCRNSNPSSFASYWLSDAQLVLSIVLAIESLKFTVGLRNLIMC